MKILFLGGNRNFGKLVLKKLLKQNHKIFLINRNNKKNLKHKNLKHINCERSELYKVKNFLNTIRFDCVFDNIAYNLKDVINLHKLLKNNFKHYIFTSSSITYLHLNDNYDVKENDWIKGKLKKNWIRKKKYKLIDVNYALNKRKIEKYLISKKNICSTILRVPNVIGKNDFSFKTQKLLTYSINDNLINKNSFIQFVFINDLVKAIIKIINKENKVSKIYNVANDKIKINEFYNKVSKKKLLIKKYKSFSGKDFPIPVNSLINNKKIQKQLNMRFSSIDRILNLL